MQVTVLPVSRPVTHPVLPVPGPLQVTRADAGDAIGLPEVVHHHRQVVPLVVAQAQVPGRERSSR